MWKIFIEISSLPKKAPVRINRIEENEKSKIHIIKQLRSFPDHIGKKLINRGRKKWLHMNPKIWEEDMKLKSCSYPMGETYVFRSFV